MVRVLRRPQAQTDILEIWDYIAEDSMVEADRWVDRLDEKFALWATQPCIWPIRRLLCAFARRHRRGQSFAWHS